MIEIKDKNGELKLSTVIGEGSIRRCTLMKEDYVTLVFSTDEPVYLKIGDGIDNEWGMFELVDLYSPTYNESTGGYDYQLRLDAYYWKWKNKIFKYTPENHGQEASWSLTATLDVHLGVFLRNLQALGYKYRNTPFSFEIGNTVENTSQLITYENTNLIDALNMMAETWDCEWWVTDSVIHFGKCEYGDPVKLELGVEVETMTREGNNQKFATRIYAFGSTNNIPSDYRPVDESVVVNGVVQKRLMLPEGTPYLDAYENMTQEEAVEDVVIFDDVYPRRIGTLSGITTQEYTDTIENEDGTETEEKWLAYRFRDAGINFSKEYILPGQELQITFQSGKLNGLTFGVIFNPTLEGEEEKPEKSPDGSWNPEAQLWEIVRNEDYGRPLPGGELIPANGDTYYLTGFNIKLVSDQYIPAAEEELKEKAQKYLDKTKTDPNTYNCTLRPDYVYNKDMEEEVVLRTFELGDKINLVNPTFFSNGRVSRVIGYERKLDIPYDHPVYFVGEVASTSRIGELEDKVDALTYKGQTFTGNGSGVYVVGRYDSTPLSDRNVLSSLKAISTFLRKDMADSTPYLLRLLAGSYFGKYIEGQTGGKIDANGIAEFLNIILRGDLKSINFSTGALGSGYALQIDENGDSYLEIDRLLVRKIAYFVELVIQRMSHVGGQIVLTPASMKCVKVEEHDDYYRCYFESTDGDKEITNDFVVGDQARSQTFNIKTGTSQNVSNSYYWRLVVGVGDDYIDLSKTDCDAGSTVPQADDEIVLLGNRTDATRQAAIVLASYGNDAPYIKLYRGINSYQLSGKEFISFSRTQIKMIADELYFSTGESVSTVINGVKSDLEETKTEFQGKIDTVDSKVEGIQIGVRNLASKTKITNNAGATINGYEYTFSAQNTDGLTLNKDIFELNEEYVLSFRMHVNSGTLVNIGGHQQGFSINNVEINGTKAGGTWQGGIEGGLDTENLIIAHVRKTSDEGNIGLWIQPNRMAGTLVNVTISEISVVKGNKYVGWSPAPEDLEAAAQEAKDLADAAQAAADAADAKADSAKEAADAAKDRLDDWAADSVISPTEKQGLKDETARIDGDKSEITANYTKYGLGTPTAYNSAHSAYRAVLVTLSASTPETIAIPSDFATKQTAYYTARTNALTAIAEKAKQVADAAQDAADAAQESADNANNKIDNLQIGGRNLIKNSKLDDLTGWNKDTNPSGISIVEFDGYKCLKVESVSDGVYTSSYKNLVNSPYSGEMTTSIDVYATKPLILSIGIADIGNHISKIDTINQWVRLSTTQNCDGEPHAFIIHCTISQEHDGIYFKNVKLEVGNKATDWSPAPEDIQAEVEAAQQAASDAQEAATAAQSDATEAKTELNQINSDSVISPVEKTALKQQQADIQAEYNEIIADAGRYSISTTAYKNAYTSANNALTKYTATSPTYITVGSDYANIAAYYDARQTILNSIAAAAKKASDDAMQAAEDEAELAKWRAIGYSWNSGKPLWTDDPTFKTGTNRLVAYDNAVSGSVKFTREAKQSDSPVSDSEYNLKIVCSGGGSPNNGGFQRNFLTRANAVFVFRFIAKLPEGTGFDFNYSSYGAEGTYRWVTSNRGTGRFEEYICVAKCGATGSFSTIGYFSISGTAPVTCYLAYAGAFDVTAGVSTGEQLQTVSGTVTTLSSELTNTKEALESYKDEVEVKFTAAATTTEEQIENAVVNLQKGMRNLVKQGLYNIVGSTEYYIKAVLLTKELVPGSVYTIVLKATILGTQSLYVFDSYSSYGQIRVYPADLVNGIFVGSFEYAPNSIVTNHSLLTIYNYPSSGSAANPMDLEWVCLYEGDITHTAPDYFVNAPEDLDLEINSVKQSVSAIEQTAENISLRVTTTETKVTTAQNTADAAQTAANNASTKADTNLTAAKEYADDKKQEAINTAAADATSKANDALADAKADATTKANNALASAKTDAQNKADAALSSAKSYADTKDSSTLESAKNYAESEAAGALSDAKDYTDGRTKPMWKGWIDATALDQNTYYPVTMYLTIANKVRIEVRHSLDGTVTDWSTHASGGYTVRCIWESIGSGWGVNTVKRWIYEYSRNFTKEETVTIGEKEITRYVEPLASIGQMGNSSREYIYVRGGGKYYFMIEGDDDAPVLHSAAYTASQETIEPRTPAEITPIEITGVTKTELKSEIEVLEDAINLRVTKTDYDANNVALNQQIGQLETSYNSINGTVSSLNTRLGVLEESGFIVQDDFVTLFSQQLSESGDLIASYLNLTPDKVTLGTDTLEFNADKVKFVSENGLIKLFDGTNVINVNNGKFLVKNTGELNINNGVFKVTNTGALTATNANITGTVTATILKATQGGQIGGFEISGTVLRTTNKQIVGGNTYYYGLTLTSQLMRYLDDDDNVVFIGAHPDETVGGKRKLGTFMLDGGDYTSMSSGDSIALICAAPTTATITGKSVALWVNGVSLLRGIDLINRLGTRSGTVTVTPNDSVMCISGDVTLSADSNLKYLCDDGFVHSVLIINTSNSKRFVKGLRNGNSATILGYWSKLFCYTQGYWYGPSDEY